MFSIIITFPPSGFANSSSTEYYYLFGLGKINLNTFNVSDVNGWQYFGD